MLAHGGWNAIQTFESASNPPHLLVTDVIMPDLTGPVLATRLRRMSPELKVLFISGYAASAIVGHGVLDPGMAFLHKPFTPSALARKVREVLDQPT